MNRAFIAPQRRVPAQPHHRPPEPPATGRALRTCPGPHPSALALPSVTLHRPINITPQPPDHKPLSPLINRFSPTFPTTYPQEISPRPRKTLARLSHLRDPSLVAKVSLKPKRHAKAPRSRSGLANVFGREPKRESLWKAAGQHLSFGASVNPPRNMGPSRLQTVFGSPATATVPSGTRA